MRSMVEKRAGFHKKCSFKNIKNATRFFEDFRPLVNLVNLEPRVDSDLHEAYIEGQKRYYNKNSDK